jgi:hypothetical protein
MTAQRHRLLTLLAAPLLLSGCYVVPLAPADMPAPPLVLAPAPVVPLQRPVVLAARLYPANDLAAEHGMIVGSVVDLQTGRGRFRVDYRGETLVGEATRADGDERRGVASAYGTAGTTLQCDYRMTSPRQGTGTCIFGNGARYTVHLGG